MYHLVSEQSILPATTLLRMLFLHPSSFILFVYPLCGLPYLSPIIATHPHTSLISHSSHYSPSLFHSTTDTLPSLIRAPLDSSALTVTRSNIVLPRCLPNHTLHTIIVFDHFPTSLYPVFHCLH